jgi:hypothetical protein
MKLTMIAASLILAGSAQAQSPPDKYELSERCGKRAAEVFTKGKQETGLTTAADDYENHYSSRLNKCFYLKAHQTAETKSLRLFDLNDHKEIGSYVGRMDIPRPVKCALQEKRCESEEEFRALIKPFMED